MTRLVDVCRRHPASLALPSALIVLVTLIAVAGTKWYLTGDFSHTEFIVRAIPRHPPLIGVAARVRDQGSTAGPSMAYLLYPVYKLLGSNAFALMVSVDVLHVAAIAGTVALARRIGGLSIALFVAVVLTACTVALAPTFFLEPWNVWVPVFAFALFLVLVWGLTCEHIALLPLAVAVGSHCVQTHISYTVLVVGLLGAVCGWLAWVWSRTDRLDGHHPLRWTLISVAVLVIVWLPPLIEQFQAGTGNLRKIYEQFTDPGEPYVGVRAALKAMVGRFNLFGPWINQPGKDPRAAPSYIGFVLFVTLVVVAARWAWRRRQRTELSLYAVLALTTVLGFVSTTRIYGTFFEYVIRWMTPLVALWIATSLWSCWLTWRQRRPLMAQDRMRRVLVLITAAVTVAVTAIGVVRAAGADIPYRRDSAITGALAAQLRADLQPDVRYQINEVDPVALGSVSFGLALELERHGVHAGVGPWGRNGVMPFRVVDDAEAGATLWYTATQPLIDAVSALPGAVVRAQVDVRTVSEVQRSQQLQSELIAALCDTGRPDLRALLFSRWGDTVLALTAGLPPRVGQLLDQYVELRQPAAVVELPVGVAVGDASPTVPPCPS